MSTSILPAIVADSNAGAISLQVRRLACARGGRRLFQDLDFELGAGDALRVAGANGRGKSSLLRILCGLARPEEGAVRWRGRDIAGQRGEFGRELVYLGHAGAIKDDLTALENLLVGALLAGAPVPRGAALAALEADGLGEVAALPAGALSQGQRKRVALARLRLAATAPLWLLDEPFTALDAAAVGALRATLNGHLERGGMLVYTTHQEVALEARTRTLDLDRCGAC